MSRIRRLETATFALQKREPLFGARFSRTRKRPAITPAFVLVHLAWLYRPAVPLPDVLLFPVATPLPAAAPVGLPAGGDVGFVSVGGVPAEPRREGPSCRRQSAEFALRSEHEGSA
jgi:hypothetical protein